MGMGSSQPSNAVYFDAEKGQYYTGGSINPYNPLGNISAISNLNSRNYIGSSTSNKDTMIPASVNRANAAYQNTLAGLSNNPAQNLSMLFPNLSNPSSTQDMMGAGRFLGQQQQAMPAQMNYGYTPQQSSLLNALMNPGMNMTSGVNQGMGGMATPQFSFNTQA